MPRAATWWIAGPADGPNGETPGISLIPKSPTARPAGEAAEEIEHQEGGQRLLREAALSGQTFVDHHGDLGGLNLSTVPKVFIECGNMRDTKDAALLTSGAWRQKAAQGISEGIVSFLRG